MTLKSSDLFPVLSGNKAYKLTADQLGHGITALSTGQAAASIRRQLRHGLTSLAWPSGTAPVVLPNGDIAYHDPYTCRSVYVYNYASDVQTAHSVSSPPPGGWYSGTATGWFQAGFTLAPTGCCYSPPLGGTAILKFDPETKQSTWLGDFTGYGIGAPKWGEFAVGHDGMLYAAPYNLTNKNLLKLNPLTDEVTEIACPVWAARIGNNSVSYTPMLVANNGIMYMAPLFANSNTRCFGWYDPFSSTHGVIATAPITAVQSFCAGADGAFYTASRDVNRVEILRFNPRSETQSIISVPPFGGGQPFSAGNFLRGKLLPSGQIFYLEAGSGTDSAIVGAKRIGYLFDPPTEAFCEIVIDNDPTYTKCSPVLLPSGELGWIGIRLVVGEQKAYFYRWTPEIPVAPSVLLTVSNSPVAANGTINRPFLHLRSRTQQGRVFVKREEKPTRISYAGNFNGFRVPATEQLKSASGVLNNEGHAVFSPGNNQVVWSYDPIRRETVYQSINAGSIWPMTQCVWGGISMMPDGRALVVPNRNDKFAIVRFDGGAPKYVNANFTASNLNLGWFAPVLGHDGFVYAFPALKSGRTPSVLKFDCRTDTFENLTWPAAATSTNAAHVYHRSAVITDTGLLIGLPWGHTKVSEYNVNTQALVETNVTMASTQGGRFGYSTAILVGGKVFGIPYYESDILEYTISTRAVRKIPLGRYTTPDGVLYGGGCLAADGKIYMFPDQADAVCIFDPATSDMRFVETKTNYPTFTGMGPSVLLPTGDIVVASGFGTENFEWPVNHTALPTPMQLSPYQNHS